MVTEHDWLDHYNQVVQYKSPANNDVIINNMFSLFAIPRKPILSIDLGCGTGLWASRLQTRTNGKVIGVDFAENRILEAKRKTNKVQYLCMKIGDFLYHYRQNGLLGGKPVDVVSFFEVLEHMADPVMAVHNAKKIVAPEGKLIGSVPLNSVYKTHLHVFKSEEEVEQRFDVKVLKKLNRWVFFQWENE